MFTDIIRSTALTTNAADNFYGDSINGGFFNGDFSLQSIARAIIYPRLDDGDSLTINTYTHQVYNNRYAEPVKGYFGLDMSLTIINVCGTERCGFMEWAINDGNNISGYNRVEKVTAFFAKAFKVACYENNDKKSTVLFVEDLTHKKLHYISVGFPAFLPWYFAENKPNELEIALLQSLREKEPASFCEVVKKIASKYDFESEYIKKALAEFETSVLRGQKENLQSKIYNYIEKLKSLDAQYMEVLKEKNNASYTLFGIENAIANSSNQSEIMDYFMCNKSLKLISANNGVIVFIASGYLSLFDSDLAETCINNRNSNLYSSGSRIFDHDDRELLLRAIFIDNKFKIRTCAAYQVAVSGDRNDGLSGYGYGDEYITYMPNPHIDRFACTGEYRRVVRQCVENGDFVSAVETFVASSKSINFGDSYVMNEFINRMFSTDIAYANKKYIEDADGKLMTVKEAIDVLKGEIEHE